MLAPYDVLLTTCNHIVPHVLRQSKTLTPFQEFVIVLIKFRLNVPLQDLVYRSRLAPRIKVMDVRFGPLIAWLEKERNSEQPWPNVFSVLGGRKQLL